jgi:hypothetical protein
MLEMSGKETQVSSLNKLRNLMMKFPCKTRLVKLVEELEGQVDVAFEFEYRPIAGKRKEPEFNDTNLGDYNNIRFIVKTRMSGQKILKNSIKIEYVYYSRTINVNEAPKLLLHADNLMRSLGFDFSKRITKARLSKRYNYSDSQCIKNVIENNNPTEYMRLSRREANFFKNSTERMINDLSFKIELTKEDETLLFDLLAKGMSINLKVPEFEFNLEKDLPIFLHFAKTRSFNEIKPFINIKNGEISQDSRDMFELQFGS